MNRLSFIIIVSFILLMAAAMAFQSGAATLYGPPSFGKFSTADQTIFAPRPNSTLSPDVVSGGKFTNNSTFTAAHIKALVDPHPAPGANKTIAYNNSGSWAGASMARYSSGTTIHQATDRYAHSQQWRGADNSLQAYMLGSGCMVFGRPTTTAFTVTDWAAPYVLGVAGYAATTHSVDTYTMVKGTSYIFRGFTSLDANQFNFSLRRLPASGNTLRIVLRNTIRDIDGNFLFSDYSSPQWSY